MLTLIGAALIRIPLSRLQLVPLLVLFEVVLHFRHISFPSLNLCLVRSCGETVEPSVCVASSEFLINAQPQNKKLVALFVLRKPCSLQESNERSAEEAQRRW